MSLGSLSLARSSRHPLCTPTGTAPKTAQRRGKGPETTQSLGLNHSFTQQLQQPHARHWVHFRDTGERCGNPALPCPSFPLLRWTVLRAPLHSGTSLTPHTQRPTEIRKWCLPSIRGTCSLSSSRWDSPDLSLLTALSPCDTPFTSPLPPVLLSLSVATCQPHGTRQAFRHSLVPLLLSLNWLPTSAS